MYVRIFIYLFSIFCLCCVDVAFCTPFENRPKISSKNDFQLYKVTLMFSSRNITFKSNHQWKLLDGIPKIIVEETVILSNLTQGLNNAKNENLKKCSFNSNITKCCDQKKSESKSTKSEQEKTMFDEFYDEGCDLKYQSCLDLPGLEFERNGAVFKIIFNYTNGNVTFFSNKLWTPPPQPLTITVRNSYILIDNLNQKWEYENECEIPPLFCDEKSLACFQKPNLTFHYSDPYNNTFGEKKMSIIIGVLFFLTLSFMGMFLMVGIVCFERFALKNQRRLLLDMVSNLKMFDDFLVNFGSVLELR